MRYIGSKEKLKEKIISEIGDINGKVFVDLFAGTGSILSNIKSTGTIIGNDSMYFSKVISLGKNQPKKLNKIKIKKIINHLNSKSIESWITNNYSLKGSKRKYFSTENAMRIDGIRQEINNLASSGKINEHEEMYLLYCLLESVSRVSNITGTYGSFLKKEDPRYFKKLILKEEEYRVQKISFTTLDAIKFVEQYSGNVIYMDPPYTSVDYSLAYHVLEDIALYDAPLIKGITGQRIINNNKSDLSKKSRVKRYFSELIQKTNFSKIILSYSSHGLLTLGTIKKILSSQNLKFKISKISYKEYSNINKTSKGKLFEYIITIKKKFKVIKNPINYSGNKIDIINEIRKYFPKDSKRFFDVFTGGMNVPINANYFNEYFMNDINYAIINLYKAMKKKTFVKNVLEIKNKINLIRNNKHTYLELRKKYNVSKRPEELFLLLIYGFQNQFRFNSSHEFNNPVGLGYLSNLKLEQLKSFINSIQYMNITFSHESFEEFIKKIIIKPTDFFYLDPPYLITTASYNDGKRGFNGWTTHDEEKLLEMLNDIHISGGKFMLSNVVQHKNKRNTILMEWIEVNNFKVIPIKNNKREEIIVINYDI